MFTMALDWNQTGTRWGPDWIRSGANREQIGTSSEAGWDQIESRWALDWIIQQKSFRDDPLRPVIFRLKSAAPAAEVADSICCCCCGCCQNEATQAAAMAASDPLLGEHDAWRGDDIEAEDGVPVLYHADSSYFSMIARLCLEEKQTPWRSRLVDIHKISIRSWSNWSLGTWPSPQADACPRL